jgi:ribosome maturation factor RimP
MRRAIGERVEVDLFGLRYVADGDDLVATGTIVELAPGSITVRLDGRHAEVTVGPARLLGRAA